MLQELYKEITLEDMPGDMRLVAESLGIETAINLMREFAGVTFSVPRLGFKKFMSRYIISNYTGSNARQLALKFGVTERTIYEILKNEKGKLYPPKADPLMAENGG